MRLRIGLAHDYSRLREIWLEKDQKLSRAMSRISCCQVEWPPEFPKGTTKPDVDRIMDLVAGDQPMLTGPRRRAAVYCDTNGFVADPVDAQARFKRRVVWTQKERGRFVERYTLHPKMFRLIAKELPDKSVKDVIEFYYLNRFALSLKEKETSAKRRGKAKVMSEGAIKKSS
jgi:hypothetical protein